MEPSTITANSYAFLNGEEGLHETDQNLFDQYTKEGKTCILVDNLFEDPARMKLAIGSECWVVSSTGLHYKELQDLFDHFKTLNYLPTDVIILLDEEPFVSFAFKFAKKIRFHGLQLAGGWRDEKSWTYRLDYIK